MKFEPPKIWLKNTRRETLEELRQASMHALDGMIIYHYGDRAWDAMREETKRSILRDVVADKSSEYVKDITPEELDEIVESIDI